MTDVTVTTEPPPSNSPDARTADGTIKDQSQNTTPSPKTETTPVEGESFLTAPDKKPEPKADDVTDTTKTEPEKKDTPNTLLGAPEKYEDFKLPDGFKINEPQMKEVTAVFKEIGLSQEGAQRLIDFYAKNGLEASQAPYKAWADLQKEWTTEIANRFPGERSGAVKGMISNVIDTVLPPSLAKNFRAALNLTGAGSNPDVVEALSIFLKPLSEGTPVRGNGPTGDSQKAPGSGPPSVADAIYGHLRK